MDIAGKIVIILAFVMIYVGTILLDRQLNPKNWGLSIFAGIFLYNGALNWGLINYIIGIGFAIVAFWIWVRYREKIIGVSIVLFTVLGGIVCLMHLYAFGIYGVCVAGYECSVFWEKLRIERQLRMSLFRIPLTAAVSFLVPVLAVIWLSPVSSSHGPMVWGPGEAPTFWDSLVRSKAEALASPIYFKYFAEKPLLFAMFAILVWALATRTLRELANGDPFGSIRGDLYGHAVRAFGSGSRRLSVTFWCGVLCFAWASLGWGETSRARINVVGLLD